MAGELHHVAAPLLDAAEDILRGAQVEGAKAAERAVGGRRE